MSKITKRNRPLFITIMITALLQMTFFAMTPGIAKIQSEVFPEISLSTIQTIMMLPSLLSMGFSLLSAFIIHKGWISKKASVVSGITLICATGLTSIFLHTQIWHLVLYSVMIGSGMGLFVSTSASLLFDNFNEQERHFSMGIQTSFINFGGILISLAGGYLATLVWYGAYIQLLVAAPVVVVCMLFIPNDKKNRQKASVEVNKQTKMKLPLDIFYYGIITFVFLLVYSVNSNNISNHIIAAGLGNTATAGIAASVQMAGGVAAGLIFSKLSAKFKNYMIPLAFLVVFAGYMIISVGFESLVLNFIGVFIAGTGISIIIPQILFSTSNQVDASNSATSTAIVNCIFPGLGGFFSPVVFTNLTFAFGGDSTVYRYKFVAIVSLVCGFILILTTRYRNRKFIVDVAIPQTTK